MYDVEALKSQSTEPPRNIEYTPYPYLTRTSGNLSIPLLSLPNPENPLNLPSNLEDLDYRLSRADPDYIPLDSDLTSSTPLDNNSSPLDNYEILCRKKR